jgi:conjugative transposon TraN protein
LVQQPKGTANIVQLKAGKLNFTETNLSVITIDGRLYSFTVDYASQPAELNIIVARKTSITPDSIFEEPVKLSSANNEAALQKVAEKISETKAVHVKKVADNEMELKINGIYVDRDVFYFRLQLKNNSNISYDVDDIKFIVKDKQKSKRTATQETEIQPVFNYGSLANVQGTSSASCIVALPKFTLPDSKYLSVQVLEKNGGRDLHLYLKNRHIMKAIKIDDLK